MECIQCKSIDKGLRKTNSGWKCDDCLESNIFQASVNKFLETYPKIDAGIHQIVLMDFLRFLSNNCNQ